MSHPDTPPSKRRSNRLPSRGPGHGGPSQGAGIGGEATGLPAWQPGVLLPHTGMREAIRQKLAPHMAEFVDKLTEVAKDTSHPAWDRANARAIEQLAGKNPQIIGVQDLNKPGDALSDDDIMARIAELERGPMIEGTVVDE